MSSNGLYTLSQFPMAFPPGLNIEMFLTGAGPAAGYAADNFQSVHQALAAAATVQVIAAPTAGWIRALLMVIAFDAGGPLAITEGVGGTAIWRVRQTPPFFGVIDLRDFGHKLADVTALGLKNEHATVAMNVDFTVYYTLGI